jgi:hypothetical protein
MSAMKAFHTLTCTMGAISLLGDTSKRAEDLSAGTWGSTKGVKSLRADHRGRRLVAFLVFLAFLAFLRNKVRNQNLGS